jgi:ElaB/YqjD/DUF883 family membrane-anchored ribosome-binding protein
VPIRSPRASTTRVRAAICEKSSPWPACHVLRLSDMPNNGITADTIKDQARDKAETIKDQVKGLVDAGQDKVNEVREKIVDAKEKVVDKADSMMTSLESRIKARPLAAVGIAFGVGYIAMRLFRR